MMCHFYIYDRIQCTNVIVEYFLYSGILILYIVCYCGAVTVVCLGKNVSLVYMRKMAKNVPKMVGAMENDLIIGSLSVKQSRKKKQKKWTERELMNQWSEEEPYLQFGDNREITKPYENISYMSQTEKNRFEEKFHKPKNDSQTRYSQLLRNKAKKIVVANGPAGTGKTLFATEYGIRNFVTHQYERIVFTRPSVSVDEDLGYLPGTLEEKMAPWVRPIYDILYRFLSSKEVTYLMEEKIIEIAPLGYMRGRTFEKTWIVADEMQNCTVSQMKMLLTRLGQNSKLVITGDLDQHDNVSEINGLEDFLERMKGRRSSSISSFEFDKEDIQREKVVKEVLDIYGGETLPDYSSESNQSEELAEEEYSEEN